jgi:hypothetical protein
MGNIALHEIVDRLKEQRDVLVLNLLTQILQNYESLVALRLSPTGIYPR